MRTLLFFVAISAILSACSTNAETKISAMNNDNYVVILDLSDRIIQKIDQVNIDTSAIRAVFEQFEKSVQRNIVVKSRDKFSIRIIPQKQSTLPGNTFENKLSINMGKYNATEKLVKLNQFKSEFSANLALLYQQAIPGNRNSDFAGVDIWLYFKDQVNSDLNSQFNNKVMILTDGYFDFEDKAHGIKTPNMSTTTGPLLAKLKGIDWRTEAEKNEIGIIPVKLDIPAKWMICGIQPKINSKDLLEAEKLSYLWEKWLKASGAIFISKPIVNSSSEKIKSLISNNL